MTRIPVWGADAAFRAAIAQLANRVRPASGPTAAVCVVDGRQSPHVATAGRLALIVTDAARAPDSLLAELSAAGVPVIVHRPRLRSDDVAAAGGAESLCFLSVDVVAARTELWETTVDAVGWARSLAGGPLVLRHVARSAEALLIALDGPGGVPVSLSITRLMSTTRPSLLAVGVGERRVEVELDEALGMRDVRIHDADGEQLPRRRHEAAARLTLRRALAALDGAVVSDLDDLVHDRELANAFLRDFAS
ncbi:hypothetical protein [Microbacterium sp. CFBP9034]|uniref:hypothetical protein n=1 Tax=Microbacterium sp. CFBP9034 TaxID=3096540 RepID=UPI002A6A178C|nr:hypothetical protein [Microbacterium sp. CFBP9034]MDY0911168.1 hypothetical protein [Microbacterium sp. CFBP9034]